MKRLVALLYLTGLDTPALAADPHHGQQLAQRLCVSCHQISPDRPRSPKAPAFADIPRRVALDEVRLTFYLLLEKNRQMIGRALSPTEAADLAAYIVNQGR